MAATTRSRRTSKPAAQPEPTAVELDVQGDAAEGAARAAAPEQPELPDIEPAADGLDHDTRHLEGVEPTPATNGSIRTRASKPPTQLHRDFTLWLQEQTGVQVDPKAVQLTISLLGEYQKSPERKAGKRPSAATQLPWRSVRPLPRRRPLRARRSWRSSWQTSRPAC